MNDDQERSRFEARFPVPYGVTWTSTGYEVRDDYMNSYACNSYVAQWLAWKEARKDLEQVAEGEELEFERRLFDAAMKPRYGIKHFDYESHWTTWRLALATFQRRMSAPVAWLFNCRKPGHAMQYASIEDKGTEHWPVDQWTKIERTPLVPALGHKPVSEHDMQAVCMALGFDPTNHHNAEKCPYCRPQLGLEHIVSQLECTMPVHEGLRSLLDIDAKLSKPRLVLLEREFIEKAITALTSNPSNLRPALELARVYVEQAVRNANGRHVRAVAEESLAKIDAALAGQSVIEDPDPVPFPEGSATSDGAGGAVIRYTREDLREYGELKMAEGYHRGRMSADSIASEDSERLDWLESNDTKVFKLGQTWYETKGYGYPNRKASTLRGAIDAARKGEGR